MTEWDEHAATWDDDPAVRAYAAGAASSLDSLAHTMGLELDGAAVCDFGCGTGTLTEQLAGRCERIDSIDSSAAMLDVVRAKVERNGWTHVRPLAQLPARPQSYDLIACSSVLAFVEDYPAQVTALVHHLVAGGLFVQWDWELDPDDDEPFGLTRAEIRRTLTGAGLVDVAVGVGFEATVGGETMRPLLGSGRRA